MAARKLIAGKSILLVSVSPIPGRPASYRWRAACGLKPNVLSDQADAAWACSDAGGLSKAIQKDSSWPGMRSRAYRLFREGRTRMAALDSGPGCRNLRRKCKLRAQNDAAREGLIKCSKKRSSYATNCNG
jgi:hypothetical protein